MDPNAQNNANIEARLAKLEKQMASLYSPTQIPLDVERAFNMRGFSKVSIVSGSGTIAANGTFRQPIPGANKTSVGFVCLDSDLGAAIGCDIIQNNSGGYELLVEGTATNKFHFIVFTGTNYTDYR